MGPTTTRCALSALASTAAIWTLTGLASCGAGSLPNDDTPVEPVVSGPEQCPLFERDPTQEPDLMAWDATQRQKVNEKRSRGVVALEVHKNGCDVTARVVDCEGSAKYEYQYYYARDTLVAANERDVYAKLPLGAASLRGELSQGNAIRIDYVIAGSYVLPSGTDVKIWTGTECDKVTHYASRVVVGGFARAAGEERSIRADVGIFGAEVGAGSSRSKLSWREEGSPPACQAARTEQTESAGCNMPLRLELRPMPGGSGAAPGSAPATAAAAQPTPKPANETWSNGKGPQMRLVPGGSFSMGSDSGDADEKPVHQVSLARFYLDETEVTVGQYKTCADAGPCEAPESGGHFNDPKASGRQQHPVNGVSWTDASAFCKWADKRLPSEEEWEYAARASGGFEYPWGAAAPGTQLCWNGLGNDQGKGNRASTCPVASYPAGVNAHGIHDLAGNVWEWTSSAYCPYTDTGKQSCTAADRVFRGGGWRNDSPSSVRGSTRGWQAPTLRDEVVGFRCSRSL